MATIGSLIIDIVGNIDPLKKGISRGIDTVKKAGGKFGAFGKKALGVTLATGALAAGTAIIGIGTAAAGVGSASLDMAQQIQQSQNTIQATLGTTQARADELGQVAVNVFRNNFGGSIAETTAALVEARHQLGDLADNELQLATENAFRLADSFDVGVGESLSAVRTLTDEFGLSQQQAFDFLATGFQNGLNASGDFLDTIGEYSNLFAESGATAGQFFSLMETGMAGGVLGTDKAADTFKEFQIRFLEGGDEIAEAVGGLGLSYDEMIAGIQAGDTTVAESFQTIVDGLGEMEDPIARNKIGTALLGTQFEDLGASTVTAMDLGTAAVGDMAGATETLDAKYNDLGSAMEGLKRKALVALAPIGDILLRGINQAMPFVERAIDWFTVVAVPKIQEFAERAGAWIAEFISRAKPIIDEFSRKWDQTLAPAMLLVQDALRRISAALGISQGDFSGMNFLLTLLKGTLDAVIIGIQGGAIIFQGIAFAVEKVSEAVRIGMGLWDQMGDIVERVGDKIPDWLKPGSPPPLFHALKDIEGALKQMPDISEAMGFNNAPQLAGAGETGGLAGGTAGGTMFNITIYANDEDGGRRAGEGFVGALRERGLLVGA